LLVDLGGFFEFWWTGVLTCLLGMLELPTCCDFFNRAAIYALPETYSGSGGIIRILASAASSALDREDLFICILG